MAVDEHRFAPGVKGQEVRRRAGSPGRMVLAAHDVLRESLHDGAAVAGGDTQQQGNRPATTERSNQVKVTGTEWKRTDRRDLGRLLGRQNIIAEFAAQGNARMRIG